MRLVTCLVQTAILIAAVPAPVGAQPEPALDDPLPAPGSASPTDAASGSPDGDTAQPAAAADERVAQPPPAPAPGPWRLGTAIGLPSWMQLGLARRSRYEHLWDQFRAGTPGDDRALLLRTALTLELRFEPVFIGFEVMDSRAYFTDDNTPLDTSLINPLEPLQVYVGATFSDLFLVGLEGEAKLGRFTLDVGSRRLVARNRFRNTINSFGGLDVLWQSLQGDQVRLFATSPVQRLPDETAALKAHRIELDRESLGTLFWGAFYASRPLAQRVQIEGYFLGLHESDESDLLTRNRRLFTPGFRVQRPVQAGDFDFEVEGAIQLGRSRASTSADDQTDLKHRAGFGHATLGQSLKLAWEPRVALLYDYASGDSSPDDDKNGRFDTLFGARRFDFGPTGIYGALARSNINSPGLEVGVKPAKPLDGALSYRAVWLARSKDAWPAAGVRDATGASGRFLGQQLEGRLRWKVVPGSATFEVGLAHIFLGKFSSSAPNTNGQGDPTYVYTQLEFEI